MSDARKVVVVVVGGSELSNHLTNSLATFPFRSDLPHGFGKQVVYLLVTHRSHSGPVRCRCTGGGSWPGSCCLLCPALRSESGSSRRGARRSPTRTPCHLGTSSGSPERTESHCWARARWGRSHHLQDDTNTAWVQTQRDNYTENVSDLLNKYRTAAATAVAVMCYCFTPAYNMCVNLQLKIIQQKYFPSLSYKLSLLISWIFFNVADTTNCCFVFHEIRGKI